MRCSYAYLLHITNIEISYPNTIEIQLVFANIRLRRSFILIIRKMISVIKDELIQVRVGIRSKFKLLLISRLVDVTTLFKWEDIQRAYAYRLFYYCLLKVVNAPSLNANVWAE